MTITRAGGCRNDDRKSSFPTKIIYKTSSLPPDTRKRYNITYRQFNLGIP